MKSLRFTFKNEAIWMVIFAVAPLAIALLAILIALVIGR